MTKRYLRRISLFTCGALLVSTFSIAPVRAEQSPVPDVDTSATEIVPTPGPETESTDVPTAVPETPSATPDPSTAAPSAAPTATPAPASLKQAFPDEKFRKFVNETYFSGAVKDEDIMTEGQLSVLAAQTGKLDVRGKEIVNLRGIEYFTGITELDCAHNALQLLDISTMSALTAVDVSYNDLTELTLGKDSKLVSLNCSNNMLTALALPGIVTMQNLNCSDNKLAVLNVAGLYQLTTLDCSNNNLSAMNVDGLVALENLYCDGNAILNLDISALKNLKVLENRKSVITLKLQGIAESDCGVVLPAGAAVPTNISNSGAYKKETNAIVWDKANQVPASFTYNYTIPGTIQNVTVTVIVDKTEFAGKVITMGQVQTLTAKSTAYNKVKLQWSNVDGATGYRIYRSTSKTGGFTKIKSITSNNKVTYTNSGLSCGVTYYYRVRAYRLVDGNYYFGEYSPIISGKAVPAKPGSVTVAKAAKKKVKISWNKVAGASGYRVYRSKSKASGFSKIKTLTSGAKLSYTKKTARKVKYYYKVRAYKTVNGKKVWGAYSAVKGKTLS